MVQVPRRKGRKQSLHKVSWKPGPRATGNTHSIAAVFKFLLAQFPIQDGDRSPHPRKMAGALKYYMPGIHLPKLRPRALPSPETSPRKLQGAREPHSWQNQRLLGCTWGFRFRIEGRPHSAQWWMYSDRSQCPAPDTGLTARGRVTAQGQWHLQAEPRTPNTTSGMSIVPL